MIYFSPSLMAFFDDAVHGARLVEVVDSTALTEALGALTSEEFAGEDALADVADQRAALLRNPPVQMVPNPDCGIPEDGVEISAEHHATLMQGQADGLMIGWDAESSLPMLKRRPVDHEALIMGVKKERDRLLRESDWTQLPDNELSKADRLAWKAWRQAVREAARGYEDQPRFTRPDVEGVFPTAPVADA